MPLPDLDIEDSSSTPVPSAMSTCGELNGSADFLEKVSQRSQTVHSQSPPLSASSSRVGLASFLGSDPRSTCSLSVGNDRRTSFIDCKEAANSFSMRASVVDSLQWDESGVVSQTVVESLRSPDCLHSSKDVDATVSAREELDFQTGSTLLLSKKGDAPLSEVPSEQGGVSSSAVVASPNYDDSVKGECQRSRDGPARGPEEQDALRLLRRRRQWLLEAAETVFQPETICPDVFTAEEEGRRRPLVLAALAEALELETALLLIRERSDETTSPCTERLDSSRLCTTASEQDGKEGEASDAASPILDASEPVASLSAVRGFSRSQLEAAKEEAFDLVRLLLARGASLRLPSQTGVWPLQFVIESASPRVT